MKAYFLGVFLLSPFLSFCQTRIGIALKANTIFAEKISTEDFHFGHSGKPFTQKKHYSVNPYITLEREIYKKFSVQTGIGYNEENYSFRFLYVHQAMGPVDRTFKLSAHYLSIPVLISRPIKLFRQLSLLPSVGFEHKLALASKNNYQDIIFEEVWIIKDSYFRRFTLDAFLSLGLRNEFRSGAAFDVSFFWRRGITGTFNGHIGFNKNLQTARGSFAGICAAYSIKY